MRLPPQFANTRNSHFLEVVARLKPGVAVETADREMKGIAAQLTSEYPDSNRDVGAVVFSVREDVLGDTRVELLVLMIAAASIVLIACANLASLLLSRAWARRGEYAVRLSLGATRTRLVRQIVTEALCLSVIGGALGLAIPLLTGTMIERLVPVGLHTPTAVLDWRLLAFAAALSIATGLLFSLGPAFQSSRASTAEALQQHARGAVGTGTTGLFRDGLVVLQVAATLVLLVAAGLMLRTLANLHAIELGFNPDRLLTMQVSLPQPKYADETKRNGVLRSRGRRCSCAAGRAKARRLARRCRSRALATRSRSRSKAARSVPGEVRDALYRVGTSDYLKTLGAVVAEGRLIDERDAAGAPRAVVVNQTMARQFLPNQSALGHRIRFDPDGPWFTIVGVVRRRARTWLRAGGQARGVRVVATGRRQSREPRRSCRRR